MVIENPVINSAFVEPRCHFKFTDDGITDEIVGERRLSAYFLPIAAPKTKGKQIEFDTEWLQDRAHPNEFINEVRQRVRIWRAAGHPGVTLTTARLLDHWTSPDRERRLFFCQIEAAETAIYVAEVAERQGDHYTTNKLRQENAAHNPDLLRMAFKMATGSGKTVVMTMLIAWHTLNKVANPKDTRFGDSFLVVTPGITIKDRLRVLLPSDPENYYRKMDLVPEDLREELQKAKVMVTNYHAFIPREKVSTSKTGKMVLTGGKADSAGIFTETPGEMVRRVCREFGPKKNLIVINDEAHHCYRSRPADKEKLSSEDREEARERENEARVWISGLEAVKRKLGVPVVYDLSATPFFLRGSGYSEGTLFPWVVSDFSLIDAIECGIVKVPRVPVADDSNLTEVPTYRNIWIRIRDHLPKM
ncbi:MAG: DEAD/DEAH box helicase family protein, partial [Candidatus Thermoplasmatota archaeon]|nr:DEAD/DEAH box helicase family protein [Candidatus Thermoplasmatota archaeon]